jgi:hypothetical protein
MEYYNNILCIEAGWLVNEGIFSKSNYDALKRRQRIRVIRNSCYSTPALVAYDSIPERFRSAIREKVGDPYKVATKSQLAELITPDLKARTFFDEYTMDNGEHLPAESQAEYTQNASILNAIHTILNDRSVARKSIAGTLKGIWPKLAAAVLNLDKTVFKHTLPPHQRFDENGDPIAMSAQAYRKLQDRYNRYKASNTDKFSRIGYESLIHRGWCNTNSEKINDEAKVWILSKWTNMVSRSVNEQALLVDYNFLAESMGWKPLKSVNSIHNFLYSPEIKPLWWAHRYGELSFKEKFVYQHKTLLPSMRDSLWYSDGTKLNYYYQYRDEQGRFKMGTTSVYEVMDAFSEVMLGYYISDNEDYVAQYNGYRMALQFAGHKPYQITYDNQGGHKKLESGGFLEKLAHLSIPTKPYNGKSKTIESAFGRFQSHYLKKDWFFTGQNITTNSLESKANIELIMANKHNLPTLDEVKATYLERRNEWNNAKRPKSDKTRLELYNSSVNPRTPKVELMDMVELFWILRDKPVQYSAYGLSFEEKKVRYDYVVNGADGMPDVRWHAMNVDKKFRVKYDPNDFAMIYLYEDTPQGLRFITSAEQKVAVHRGKQEQEDWEALFLTQVEAANRELREETFEVVQEYQRKHNMHAEQNGLNMPGLKGNGKNKKGKKKASTADNFGKIQKAISNATATEDVFDENEIYKMM